MFLLLEGIDCSGKTTVGKLIAQEYPEFVYYATPPEQFLTSRTEIDRNASAYDHYLYYRDALHTASKELWDLLASGKSIVCDRYWLTTYVYHTVMGLEIDVKDFETLVQPDRTVLLMVSPIQQIRRFSVRGLTAGDQRMLNKQEQLSREYKRALAQFVKDPIAVSTDELTTSEVVRRIMELCLLKPDF